MLSTRVRAVRAETSRERGGSWGLGGGAKADASSKRQISQAAREHGRPPARAGGPPRARITKATRRYGPKSITNASLRRDAWDRVESRNYGRPAYASYYRSSARPPGYARGLYTPHARCTGRAGVGGPRRPGVRGPGAGTRGSGRTRPVPVVPKRTNSVARALPSYYTIITPRYAYGDAQAGSRCSR